MTAKSALSSRYFMVDPKLPSSPMELGAIDLGENENRFHEFQMKKRRKEAKMQLFYYCIVLNCLVLTYKIKLFDTDKIISASCSPSLTTLTPN